MTEHEVGGPYFDELAVGQVFDTAPAVTLTDGLAAGHQAILGDRLRLPLDHGLATAVTGAPMAHPGLVCDLAIGQSTLVTHHVKANLFYRGLRFHRFPAIGDTLATRTEVVGLRANSVKPNRPPTGLVALRITTTDQQDRPILDFYRCAMLPFRADRSSERPADDLSAIGPTEPPSYAAPVDWDLPAYRARVPDPNFDPGLVGVTFQSSGDVVSNAPELARLTLNIAATHHDARVGGGRRLVYGGHTIGIALAQAARALPNIATVLGWASCDHTGPVYEGDTLTSALTVERAEHLDDGGLYHLRSVVFAHRAERPTEPVLDWRFTVLLG